MTLLEGKVAIVTGASRGIGRGIAVEFAEEGADIVIAARTEQRLERIPGTIFEVAEEVRSLGRRALPVRCDVCKDEDVESLVACAVKEFDRIDILVNNTGIMTPGESILEVSAKQWDLVMKVNLRGTFICTKAVLPVMLRQREGSIINISSRAASRPRTANPYGVSKAAIDRFSQGLAEELKDYNIAVNSLLPSGTVLTEGWQYWSQQGSIPPPKNVETPQDVGRAAVFLAVQDASGISGQILSTRDIRERYHIS